VETVQIQDWVSRHADIIVYALIALALLGRLWQVFGQRGSHDINRPNPFTVQRKNVSKRKAPPVSGPTRPFARPPQQDVPFNGDGYNNDPSPQSPDRPPIAFYKIAPNSLEGGLEQIRAADPTFDEKKFLTLMRERFSKIVQAYASGNLKPCAAWLAPSVRQGFEQGIQQRKAAGEIVTLPRLDIREAECTKAALENKQASITVCFVSHQETALSNANGQVIGGSHGKIEEVTDIWRFTRDTANPSADWVLAETRG